MLPSWFMSSRSEQAGPKVQACKACEVTLIQPSALPFTTHQTQDGHNRLTKQHRPLLHVAHSNGSCSTPLNALKPRGWISQGIANRQCPYKILGSAEPRGEALHLIKTCVLAASTHRETTMNFLAQCLRTLLREGTKNAGASLRNTFSF